MTRAVLSWSGGKDAAMALYALNDDEVEITELLTTISETTGRSSMHGVRESLYRAQASALGLPLRIVELPDSPSNEVYESIMADVMSSYDERGFDTVVFGDLYLEDVRTYREDRLDRGPLEGHWPLWGWDTKMFMKDLLTAGFRAIVVAANDAHFDRTVLGREINREFLRSLPEDVDPAGENGEFHTLVVDGPVFNRPLSVEPGNPVTREVGEGTTMHYCDIHPVD